MFGSLRNDGHWSVKGLVGYWSFMPAGKLIDLSPNKNDGILTGTTTWVNKGLALPGGAGNYVNCGNSPSFLMPDNCTMIAKWTPAANGTLSYILGQSDNYRFYALDSSNDYSARYGGATLNTNVPWVAGRTDVVAFVAYSNANPTIELYVDAVLQETIGDSDVATVNAGTAYIGVDPRDAAGGELNGTIEYVLFYNRALSASEILQLYRNPNLPTEQYPAWWGKAAAVGTTPKGPLTHPLYGPFAGPIAC